MLRENNKSCLTFFIAVIFLNEHLNAQLFLPVQNTGWYMKPLPIVHVQACQRYSCTYVCLCICTYVYMHICMFMHDQNVHQQPMNVKMSLSTTTPLQRTVNGYTGRLTKPDCSSYSFHSSQKTYLMLRDNLQTKRKLHRRCKTRPIP